MLASGPSWFPIYTSASSQRLSAREGSRKTERLSPSEEAPSEESTMATNAERPVVHHMHAYCMSQWRRKSGFPGAITVVAQPLVVSTYSKRVECVHYSLSSALPLASRNRCAMGRLRRVEEGIAQPARLEGGRRISPVAVATSQHGPNPANPLGPHIRSRRQDVLKTRRLVGVSCR